MRGGDGRWAQPARPHDIPPRLRPDMKGFRQQTSRYLRSVCAIVQNRPTFLAGLMRRLSSQLPLPNYPTPPGRKREREFGPPAGRPTPTWPAVHFSIPKWAKTDRDEVSIAAKTDLIGKSHDAQTDRERWRRKKQSIRLAQRILVCHACTRIRI